MIIDTNAAETRIRQLNEQIKAKQFEVNSLISGVTSQPSLTMPKEIKYSLKPNINISGLNTQLSQLKVKIDSAKSYLDQSNNLSNIINSGISSLEKKK